MVLVAAGGGGSGSSSSGGAGGCPIVGFGGCGGAGGLPVQTVNVQIYGPYAQNYGGGGGAGGYTGAGGAGGNGGLDISSRATAAGTGGGGGGGGGSWGYSYSIYSACIGGGVGLFGIGANGTGGSNQGGPPNVAPCYGGDGSGSPLSGAFGGGLGGTTSASVPLSAGSGACRIMWGASRSFPAAAGPAAASLEGSVTGWTGPSYVTMATTNSSLTIPASLPAGFTTAQVRLFMVNVPPNIT